MSKTIDNLIVTNVPIDTLKPYKNNARKHTDKQIRQIANSMSQFGFISPAIIDDKGNIIAGHGRIAAAKLLKLKYVPVIKADHLTEAEIKAYRIADNKIEDFIRKLEALLQSSQKGSHADLTKEHAYSFVAYTYLLVGDILRLSSACQA